MPSSKLIRSRPDAPASRRAAQDALERARDRMRIDEFDAMPLLDAAHAAFADVGDDAGCGLTARIALTAVYNAGATFEGLDTWLARTRWGQLPPADLHDASDKAWWLSGEFARVFAHAATEYTSPTTLAIREQLLDLLASPLDADAHLIAAGALLELAEFEDDAHLFDRLVAGLMPLLDSHAGSPLFRGRAWYRIVRCAQSTGPLRGRGSQRVDPVQAEARALELAKAHGLAPLHASLLVAQCLFASMAREEDTARRALFELGQVTDFRRPLPAAWFYFLRGQAAARHEDATQALLYFRQAVEAAEQGCLPASAQQNFINGLASALVHAGHWDEACRRLNALIPQQSGRDRDITECRRQIAEFHRVLVQSPEQVPTARADLLDRASGLRWMAFSLLTPRGTARFLADALREGHPPDFIAQVVARRQLAAEADFPRSWPWPVRVEALGRFRIEVDGVPVSFGARPQRKPLELLMLLVALGPQPVPAAVLIDALWPAADGDKAKSSLDMAVLRLRRILSHDDALRVEGSCLLLDRTRVWVDAWAYLEDDDAAYAGAFLDGEAGHEAIEAQRERLQAALVERTRRQGELLEIAGRGAEALRLYESALAHQPLAEVLHRGVIRCHLSAEEPAAAVLAFQRCRDRLAHKLGVQPAPATRQLVRDYIGIAGS